MLLPSRVSLASRQPATDQASVCILNGATAESLPIRAAALRTLNGRPGDARVDVQALLPSSSLIAAKSVAGRISVCHSSFRKGLSLGRSIQLSNGSRWSAVWLDNTALVETDVNISVAWDLWSDREGVSRWMPWIDNVKDSGMYFSSFLQHITRDAVVDESPIRQKLNVPTAAELRCRRDGWCCFVSHLVLVSRQNVLEDQPDLSRWTLKYEYFGRDWEFSWLARNMKPIFHQKIHWRSVDGLPNRGTVRFYPRGPTSCAVQLTISYEVPAVLGGLGMALAPVVENILQQDLNRFAKFAKSHQLESQRK